MPVVVIYIAILFGVMTLGLNRTVIRLLLWLYDCVLFSYLEIFLFFFSRCFTGMTVRLRGSQLANVSRVEVYYAGKWGSIYPWGWNWNMTDAMTVVCRQMAYARASLAGYGSFCSDVQCWFTNFRCYGNETSLDQCGRDFHASSSASCMNVICTNETGDSGKDSLRSHQQIHL